MTAAEVVTRARSAIGQGAKYKLGQGGLDPKAALPLSTTGECDCSAFAAWVVGVSKFVKGVPSYDSVKGQWFNTDKIVDDAMSSYGFVDRISEPRPGCLIVFPKLKPGGYGHVGIVTEVLPDWYLMDRDWTKLKVVHCSAGNFKSKQDAIQETDARVFAKPETIFAWCVFVKEA